MSEPDALTIGLESADRRISMISFEVLSAVNQRFLSLGAAVANLEARVIELEARTKRLDFEGHYMVDTTGMVWWDAEGNRTPPLGSGPLEPEKIATTDAPGG